VKVSAPKTENQTLSMLPQPTRGSGARCKLPNPKRGLGQSPCRKLVWVHFELELAHVVTTDFISDTFVTYRKGHQSMARVPVSPEVHAYEQR